MMNGKEKIYFLLNRIDDVRAITPSGQPLKIHPMNSLNGDYKGDELTQLFTKLEKDEQILKVLKAPGRIQTIDFVEGIVPDELPSESDDGCWHIELLSTFDDYFLNIQNEPEYQKYSNRRPAGSLTRPSSGSLMTYEDKLELIVKAVVEAKKATREGQPTTLYLNATNGLDRLDREEIQNILLQLQDEGAFKVNPKTNRLLPTHQQPANPGYFLLDDIDNFDSWYEGYLLKQNSKPENLDWLNLLKVLDVCSDIEQQLQITRNTNVTIPSFPYPYIGFSELFPVDTIGTRKSYQQYRWEGAQYLLKEGIALEARYDNDDMLGYGSIIMRVNLVKFYDFYKTIKDEFEKRKKSANENEEKPKTESLKVDSSKLKLRVTYNAQKGELDIEGRKVKLNKDSFRAKLLGLLLKDDKSRKKEWSWDEVIEIIEDTKDEELTKENKNKFYPACDGLSKFIAQKIGINDLLIYTKSIVQINPNYL